MLRAVLLLSLALAARGDILMDQNASSDTLGTRNLPQGRMWQSFTPHSSGTLLTLDVFVGVASSVCEPVSAVLLVVDGLPTSVDDLTAWADATTTPPAALLLRQPITTTCAAAVCSARECLGWESIGLNAAVAVAANSVVSFALIRVQPATSGSTTHARIGVVPVIPGSTGRSSLLVSPMFHTRFGQYAFRAYIDDNTPGSVTAGPSSNKKANSDTSTTAGTASYAVALGVVGAVAVVALVSLLVVRARRANKHTVSDGNALATAEQLRLASPNEAWNYLHGTTTTAAARKLTVAESDVDGRRASMRYRDDDESEDDVSHRPTTPSRRGRVSPLSNGTPHTLAWQPTAVFGPVQRIAVNAADADAAAAADAPASPSATTGTSSTSSSNTASVGVDAKKRRRLPMMPATASTSSESAVLVSPARTSKAGSVSAWAEDSVSSSSASAPSPVLAMAGSAASKKQRPAAVEEEEVDLNFLPPFAVREGYNC